MTAPTPSDLAVNAKDLTKRYGELVAVNSLNLQVARGEVYGVLGPNGAGKTTFLRMLFGLIRPDSGSLEVLGATWQDDGPRALDDVAGFIESPRFYPYLSGLRNLELLAGLDGRGARDRIGEALEVVDLLGREKDKVGGYSFGMRQRLGVAAALIRRPQLLVLDEPANGLDPAGIRDMRALVSRLAASGLTVLLSSHNMEEVEEICDNVTIMRTGDVVYHGSIETLREQAPVQAHQLRTSNDPVALAMATRREDIRVELIDATLHVRGDQQHLDSYIAALVGAGISIRALSFDETPLEALFFMLTESSPHGVPSTLSATSGAHA